MQAPSSNGSATTVNSVEALVAAGIADEESKTSHPDRSLAQNLRLLLTQLEELSELMAFGDRSPSHGIPSGQADVWSHPIAQPSADHRHPSRRTTIHCCSRPRAGGCRRRCRVDRRSALGVRRGGDARHRAGGGPDHQSGCALRRDVQPATRSLCAPHGLEVRLPRPCCADRCGPDRPDATADRCFGRCCGAGDRTTHPQVADRGRSRSLRACWRSADAHSFSFLRSGNQLNGILGMRHLA